MFKNLPVIAALLLKCGFAQPPPFQQLPYPFSYDRTNKVVRIFDNNGMIVENTGALVEVPSIQFFPTTVAALPAAATHLFQLWAVNDGLNLSDCTGGRGVQKVWCYSNGAAWLALGGGGGGGGNVSATGSPAANKLAIWSGPLTVTNGDITGDCTTSGSLSLTCGLSIARTGVDISTNNQVTATHLASPLASAQGGTASAFFTVAGPASSAKTFTFPNASANILTDSALVTGAQGGTNNGFFQVSGPASSLKTFTFPNASASVLTDNALVSVAQGGTGTATPALVAGSGITVSGPWPNQTIAATGGGGGASAANQLTDFATVRTSNTVVTSTFPTGGTNFGDSSYTQAFTTPVVNTIDPLSTFATSGTTVFVYYDANAAAIKEDTTAGSWTGLATTGATQANTGVTDYPADITPLARLTAGNTVAKQWDAFSTCLPTNNTTNGGCILGTSAFRTTTTLPGSFLATTNVDSHGRKTIGVATTKISNGGNATLLVGAAAPLAQPAGTPVCDDGLGGTKDTGCNTSGGGNQIIVLPITANWTNIGSSGGMGIGSYTIGSGLGNLTMAGLFSQQAVSIGGPGAASPGSFGTVFPYPKNVSSIEAVISAVTHAGAGGQTYAFQGQIGCDSIGSATGSGAFGALSAASTSASAATSNIISYHVLAITDLSKCTASGQSGYVKIVTANGSGTAYAGGIDLLKSDLYIQCSGLCQMP